MANRKEELMEYVGALQKLQQSGFDCSDRIYLTMNELHEIMMPRKEGINVVVFERGLHVAKTARLYLNLIGGDAKMRKDYNYVRLEAKETGHLVIRNQNANIYIVNQDSVTKPEFLPDKDLIFQVVNNTNDFRLPEQYGVNPV